MLRAAEQRRRLTVCELEPSRRLGASSASADCIAWRSTELNAFETSTWRTCNPGLAFSSLWSFRLICSVAPRTPTPIWSGAKTSVSCEDRRCCSTLEVRRRRTSPTAMGRTPPQGFNKGMSLAPASQGPVQGGRLPVAELSTHRTRALLKRLLSATEGTSTASRRWECRSPLWPGADKGLN